MIKIIARTAIGTEKIIAKPMPFARPLIDTKANKVNGKVRHQETKINFFRFNSLPFELISSLYSIL
jgi:hypothetical protein